MQGFKHIGRKFKGHRICATFPGKGLEPNALRALFLFMQKMPASISGIFLVPVYSREPRHADA